jgi:hypothetical protein
LEQWLQPLLAVTHDDVMMSLRITHDPVGREEAFFHHLCHKAKHILQVTAGLLPQRVRLRQQRAHVLDPLLQDSM